MKESDIQRQILDYLSLRRIFHYRNNSSAFDNGHGRFYRFGAKGSPDSICVIGGLYVGIEVKALRGRQIDPKAIHSCYNVIFLLNPSAEPRLPGCIGGIAM